MGFFAKKRQNFSRCQNRGLLDRFKIRVHFGGSLNFFFLLSPDGSLETDRLCGDGVLSLGKRKGVSVVACENFGPRIDKKAK